MAGWWGLLRPQAGARTPPRLQSWHQMSAEDGDAATHQCLWMGIGAPSAHVGRTLGRGSLCVRFITEL